MKFFCLSRDEQIGSLALAIASAICSSMNVQGTVYMVKQKKCPYQNITVTATPRKGDFSAYRGRNPHEFILCDENGDQYYNLWVNQQRGYYCFDDGTIGPDEICELAGDILTEVGSRKSVRPRDIFYGLSIDQRPKRFHVNPGSFAETIVCFFNSCVSEEEIRRLSSSFSRQHFLIHGAGMWGKGRIQGFSDDELTSALAASNFIVTDMLFDLSPYFDLLKGKTVILSKESMRVSQISECLDFGVVYAGCDNFSVEYGKKIRGLRK